MIDHGYKLQEREKIYSDGKKRYCWSNGRIEITENKLLHINYKELKKLVEGQEEA